MKAPWLRPFVLALGLAFTTVAPAEAAIIDIGFSGFLSSAVNNTYEDPTIPTNDFFQVGQAFSGSLAFDDAIPSIEQSDDSAIFDLLGYSVVIGGQDFSSRFLPRLIFRSTSGEVTFLSGGASQSGSSALSLNLPSFYGAYPTIAELSAQSAQFRYDDFTPLGGQVAGTARFDVVVPAVPEPASWLLMILGIGSAGWAARSRRSRTRFVVPQPA